MIKVSLLAYERSLDCQAHMHVFILSNKGWKFGDYLRLVRRGIPKYLLRFWTIGILVNEEILRWVSEGVFREKNSLDLEALQIWPDTSQNCENRLKRVVQSYIFALAKRKCHQ